MKKTSVISAVLFLAVSIFGLYLVQLNEQVRQSQIRESTQQILSSKAHEIEHIFAYALSVTHILERETFTDPDGLQAFNKIAEKVLQHPTGISQLQLAPINGPAKTYPLKGYEALLTAPPLMLEIAESQNTSEPELINLPDVTMHGPIMASWGDAVFIARNPVFHQQENNSILWGTAAAMINLYDLLNASGLDSQFLQHYNVELAAFETGSPTPDIIYSSSTEPLRKFQEMKINSISSDLYLRMNARGVSHWQELAIGIVLTLLFALTTAILGGRVMREPEVLRQKVASQTRVLRQFAYKDSLTGLSNRKVLFDQLKTRAEELDSENRVGLLIFDINDFKLINDTMGHPMGDLLLKAIVKRITSVIPESASMARLGGDEFTILLSGDNITRRLRILADRVFLCFQSPFVVNGNQIYITVSIGCASLSRDVNSAAKLLVAADQALFHSKKTDNQFISHFSENMLHSARHKQRLKNDLRQAIKRQELELHYQPIFCTEHKTIRKCEALLRWNHPELGSVSPMDFIPIAEQTGLIMEIGEWVFTEAATQMSMWRKHCSENFQISINVSPVQLNGGSLATLWLAKLDELKLNSNCIVVEITESVLMKNSGHSQQQLTDIRSAGFEIALDDFGTGYCSLSYLSNFDIDYVKIDRAFIKNVTQNERDKIVCTGIISIATELGLKVVAEGIENREQYSLMLRRGCHYCQGYLFSKPLSAEEFEKAYLMDDVATQRPSIIPDLTLDHTISAA
ncbi:MAG: bifunctional diguanylate cyclase/phosphodiesterase [Granulosicoccus sp.]|nr:bifunctional diguanylate cyclase/phosphodiesterase [Granulosicoccus sp.]